MMIDGDWTAYWEMGCVRQSFETAPSKLDRTLNPIKKYQFMKNHGAQVRMKICLWNIAGARKEFR